MSKLLPLSLAFAAAMGFAMTAAVAGECPPDQEVAEAMKADGHTESMMVTDTVLAVNDLGAYYPGLADRVQRIRRLVVQPGGEVAWHSHADRPALIYVESGEIVEYRSTCLTPIVHRAGEVSAELGPIAHWWRNEGDRPAVLIAADLPAAD